MQRNHTQPASSVPPPEGHFVDPGVGVNVTCDGCRGADNGCARCHGVGCVRTTALTAFVYNWARHSASPAEFADALDEMADRQSREEDGFRHGDPTRSRPMHREADEASKIAGVYRALALALREVIAR